MLFLKVSQLRENKESKEFLHCAIVQSRGEYIILFLKSGHILFMYRLEVTVLFRIHKKLEKGYLCNELFAIIRSRSVRTSIAIRTMRLFLTSQ